MYLKRSAEAILRLEQTFVIFRLPSLIAKHNALLGVPAEFFF